MGFSHRIKKFSWKSGLLSLAFLFLGCGSSGGFFIPPPRPDGLQNSESLAELQVFMLGESEPIELIQGVFPGAVLLLEARGAPSGSSISWFSSDITRGIFLKPGELHINRIGEFEIRAQVGALRVKIPVFVGDLAPNVLINVPPPLPGDPEPTPDPVASDPFMDEVVSFDPGPNAGFGMAGLPEIVLGSPRGSGNFQSSLHVLSLGVGGEIILKSDTPILDGPGEDFIVFENPFLIGGDPDSPFAEPGEVSVSQDGITFFSFPCESDNFEDLYPYCAGVQPVFANSETNVIDPTDPEEAGGDPFDLQTLGLSWIQYIRIQDLSESGSGDTAGFDLDAIAIRYQ